MLKVIIDFDGTLTAEEEQVMALAERSLAALAEETLAVSLDALRRDYGQTRARLLAAPHLYGWRVNGALASYCDEGAFLLNTTTLQEMLRTVPRYADAVARAYPEAEYDPVVDCTNALFHRFTAQLTPRFRPGARAMLAALHQHPDRTPIVLTNSLGSKVRRFLEPLDLPWELPVLGDTRQYDMQPDWPLPPDVVIPQDCAPKWHLDSTMNGSHWLADPEHPIDLRRADYYQALRRAAADGSDLAVVADTFSMPGALPLAMGHAFLLLHTSYTPEWCARAAAAHPRGRVLDSLVDLGAALDSQRV